MSRFKWVKISESAEQVTYRAKAFGGWLIKEVVLEAAASTQDSARPASVALCFVSDPAHQWSLPHRDSEA